MSLRRKHYSHDSCLSHATPIFMWYIWEGSLRNLQEKFEFYPPNLLQLELWECELRDNPMMILEKLPSLRKLGLCSDAYVGRKMICSSKGFLQLESLE